MKELPTQLPTPAPEASVIDRVKYLIRLMRLTQAEFARLIGTDPSNLSKALSGRINLTDGMVNRIVVNAKVSKSWLVDGVDVPFPRGEHAVEVRDCGARVDDPASKGAPVYDIDVTAGCAELSRMFTVDRIVGRLDMPGVDPQLPVVKVNGDSMSPRIANGSYISIRPVSNRSPLFWGQIYVVVLEDYRMVKYVRRHSDPSMVILHSANPHYDDMEVSRSQIVQLYMVEAILNYDILA